MSSLEISEQESFECQQKVVSLQDTAIFDLLKTANYEEFNEIMKQLKTLNVLQEASNSPNKKQKQLEQQIPGKENIENNRAEAHDKLYISQVVQMDIVPNKRTVDFGSCLPGQILEQPITIKNIGFIAYKIKVTVLCNDDELNELDEYVFSVRKQDDYEYNENQLCQLQPNCEEQLFVALKAPNLKSERNINGIVQVKVIGGGLCGVIQKDVNVVVNVPKVICLKELFCAEYQQPVIKLAMKLKSCSKCECKVPFKNLASFDVKVEFEVIYDKKRDDEYDFTINPAITMISSKSMSMIGLCGKKQEKKSQLKIRHGIRSQLQSQLEKITRKKSRKKEMKYDQEEFSKNLIIILKVMNSSLILCYPTTVEIY